MTIKTMTWNSGRNSLVEAPQDTFGVGSQRHLYAPGRGTGPSFFGPLPLVTCYPFYAVQNGSPLRYAVVAAAP